METLKRYEAVTKEVSPFLDKKTVTTILGAAFISSLFVFAFDGNKMGNSANSATTKGLTQSNGNDHSVGSESAAAHENSTEQVKYVLEEISAEYSAEGNLGSDAPAAQLLDIQLLSKKSRESDSEVRSDQSSGSLTRETTRHTSASAPEATPQATLEETTDLH